MGAGKTTAAQWISDELAKRERAVALYLEGDPHPEPRDYVAPLK